MDAPETVSGNGKDKETVKVVVRCRPLFGKELVEGRKSIVTLDQAAALISLKCPENGQLKSFTFDSVYDEKTSQRQFYDESGYPLVESIFDGYNGTIFAYGQTGCGKTHTMQGKESPSDLRGVIPLSFDHIFDTINADTTREYMVRASYLEIYNEDIRDLLSDDTKKRLDLKEAADGSVYVKDLTEVVVRNVQSMNNVMSRGFKNRTVGATLMNEGSSRSHSIFSVVVETSETIGGQDHFKAGKLNLVDLAGSERQSKTGATGSRLKEGCKINLSLSALGNVISALVDGKGKHIPYRDSKLTRLLQDSLGGNTKTLMVAAVSPADYNYDETLSTLRYANRAKNIKNKPIVNEDPKDAKLREYKEEIERLRTMLASQSQSRDDTSTTSNVMNISGRTSSTDRQEIEKSQVDAAEMLKQATLMMEEAKALQAQNQKLRHEGVGDSEVTVAKANSTGAVANLLPLLHRCSKEEQTSSPEPLENSEISLVAEPISAKQQAMQEADAQAKEMMAKAERMMREATERQLASQVKVVVKEVVSDAHIKEQEELRELNQTIVNQRDRIGQELEQTQVAMEKYLREKEALHAKLKKIESHILGGPSGLSSAYGSGNTQDADSEVTLLKQQVEYRRTQIKLREKVKLQAKNEAMRRTLELEKQQVEEELKTAQETAQASVLAARKKELKYKSRLEATRQEIVDLNSEFEQERENMLDTIREQTKEAKLLEQLVDLFLPQHELVKVWERAVWSEERIEWKLPKIKARNDFHLIKLPTLMSSGGVETGGAEVVSGDDLKDRQGTTGSTGSRTVRSSVSGAGTKRRKSGTFRQLSANTPYDDVCMETHTQLSSLRNDAQHISRPNSKVADLAARGMSPHNTLTGTKDRRKHKDKSGVVSGQGTAAVDGTMGRMRRALDLVDTPDKTLQKPRSLCKPEEALVGQISSVYKAQRDCLSFQREDGFVVEDQQPRDRLQSRHGSRPDSRQEAKTRCANSSGTLSAMGQLETTPPPLVPSSAPIKMQSSSRAESRGRHHRRRDQQQADEVGNDEWIEASTTGLPPFSKKKGKHTKKKKERRTKTELQVDDASLDVVPDHVSLRSFRSSNGTL